MAMIFEQMEPVQQLPFIFRKPVMRASEDERGRIASIRIPEAAQTVLVGSERMCGPMHTIELWDVRG